MGWMPWEGTGLAATEGKKRAQPAAGNGTGQRPNFASLDDEEREGMVLNRPGGTLANGRVVAGSTGKTQGRHDAGSVFSFSLFPFSFLGLFGSLSFKAERGQYRGWATKYVCQETAECRPSKEQRIAIVDGEQWHAATK